MRLFINPGHGQGSTGYDPGAVGATGLHEANVVLAISQKLAAKLSPYCTVRVYQSGGSESDRTRICNQSNAWGADYFISIHCNAFTDRSAQGIETWYYQGSSGGQRLAQNIQTELIRALGRSNRGIKATTSLQVIKNTTATAVLPEIGFISNLAEEALMKTSQWQENTAEALAVGICKYAGIAYQPTAPETGQPVEPTSSLSQGSSGDGVRWIQTRLVAYGYALTVDGDFGQLTDIAVRNFQGKNGLAADGIVGLQTREKLKVNPKPAEPDPDPEARYFVQIGAFADESRAQALADRAKAAGFEAIVKRG